MAILPRFLLLWAAMPALALGAWLMRAGGAPPSVQTMHVAVALVAALASAVLVGARPANATCHVEWMPLALTASLFLPWLATSAGDPQRWLVLGGMRLYVAPVVLPLTLLLLGAPWRRPFIHAVVVVAGAIALMGQPDAAQSTAFTLAMLVILAASDAHRGLRLSLAAILVCASGVAWRSPDPLRPVPYVEGVFTVAAAMSPAALIAAVTAAALPVVALLRVARWSASTGASAAAAYFACLFALAPWQITPVPLLGFGTGPLLGYFLVASSLAFDPRAAREPASAAEAPVPRFEPRRDRSDGRLVRPRGSCHGPS